MITPSSVNNSTQSVISAVRPSCVEYYFYSLILALLTPLLKLANCVNYCTRTCDSEAERLQEKIREFVASDSDRMDLNQLKEINHLESFDLFLDLLSITEIQNGIKEIFKGANVTLEDNGAFFQRWSQKPDAYRRISSHGYRVNCCYAISDSLFNEMLFWLDQNGNTHFQIEKYSFEGISNSLLHFGDYLEYLRSGEQQGQFGSSSHTEAFSLNYKINYNNFLNTKLDLMRYLLCETTAN